MIRLDNEIQLLLRAEFQHKVRAAPIIRQLVAWEDARLPDRLPPVPHWTPFAWPTSGSVDFTDYWRVRDRDRLSKWSGAFL